jgi:hypothetical protein
LVCLDKNAAPAAVEGSDPQPLPDPRILKRQFCSAFPSHIGPFVSDIGGLHVEPWPIASAEAAFAITSPSALAEEHRAAR